MIPKLTTPEIIALRPEYARPAPTDRPLDVTRETEPFGKHGQQKDVGTIFMVGSECQFHCVMCDLWKYTTTRPTRADDLVAQVRYGVQKLGEEHSPPAWLKLYNASNFFSAANVPSKALPEIARIVATTERLIVENHPRLTSDRILEFSRQIGGQLELAQGLETADPITLDRLNKSMTCEDFRRSCDWAISNSIDVRAFVLLRAPGMSEAEGEDWCLRSIEFAQSCGCRHVSVIPLRKGNGAIERLRELGQLALPRLATLERVMQQISSFACVVTADLWDWEELKGHCERCSKLRYERLHQTNLAQVFQPLAKQPECSCQQVSHG